MAGLMGVGSDGRPFEIDPDERNRRGVSVLLGHMPHAVVRLFADTQVRLWVFSDTQARVGLLQTPK